MPCLKNPKKILFIPYLGGHKRKITRISRYGSYSWAQFCVQWECELCGTSLGSTIDDEEWLCSQGFDSKKLQELSSFDVLSTDAERLMS